MAKKYTKTAPQNSSEEAVLKKMDEVIAAFNALCAKLDADATVTDTNYTSLLEVKQKMADIVI